MMLRTKLLIYIFLFAHYAILGQDYKERLAELEAKVNSFFYSNKDSTYHYYDKIYRLAVRQGDYITAIDNLNYVCIAAGPHFDTDKIQSTIVIIDSLILKKSAVLDTLQDKGDYQKNYLNYNKGNYFHKLEDYQQAKVYFDDIIRNLTKDKAYKNKPDDLIFLSTCYSFVADMNARQNRFKVADNFYLKNIRLFKEYMPDATENLHKIYNLYANSLYSQKKYTAAKKLWLETLSYAENNYSPNNRNSIVTTSILLSKTYSDMGKLDSAYHFIEKIEKYKIPKDPFIFRYYISKADILEAGGKYDAAEKSFSEALLLAPEQNKPPIYKKIGDLFAKQKLWGKALESYQIGLRCLTTDFDSKDRNENPLPSQVPQTQELMRLLRAKSKALNSQKNPDGYSASVSAVETAIATIDFLKPKFKNEKDKAFLIEEAFPAFESGIEAVYQLYRQKENKSYLNKAFFFFEKSKAVVLLGAILSSQANRFSQIPNSLLEDEKRLKSDIIVLEKKIALGEKDTSATENQLFDVKNQYRGLVEKIEKEYTQYYNLKYNNTVSGLPTFQKSLGNSTLALSYFYGNDAIYVLGITKGNVEFHKTPIDNAFSEKLSAFYENLQNNKSEVAILTDQGAFLYDRLIAPMEKDLDYQKLLIMPDGLLNYLPFGALSTQRQKASYLIEKATISYTNSATLLNQLAKKKERKYEVLAVAPSFNGTNVTPGETRNALLPLVHNKKEIKRVLSYFDGKGLEGDNASLQNFTSSLAEDFGILHLATHAVFDDADPEYSYLAFSPSATDEFLLYVRDLYNIKIKADLVSLSACETGVGELKRGEGFMGLARGFFYAGASSIASTLWKVNDASSTHLMDLFYKNLAEGEPKDRALQKAKVDFLVSNSQNPLKHPYYWSGYIISGNNAPLKTSSGWGYLAVSVVLVIGGVWTFRRKKRAAA